METHVDLQHPSVTVAWFQPLSPETTRVRACDLVANPSGEQLAALWNGLASGSSRVVDEHSDRIHHYLELMPSLAAPLSPVHLARWTPLLLGSALKVVAANEGVASSTVAASAARCLRSIGLERTAREAPMLLAMMAGAAAKFVKEHYFGSDLYSSVVVRVRRPDLAIASLLSPGELAVVQLRVDGLSHSEIAMARSTSVRTVANQLAAAYRKLGVSGRCELLANLIQRASDDSSRIQPLSRYPARSALA